MEASDKLPALSGLAQSFHEYQLARGFCDKYHAGLWESDIIKGLLWLNNTQFILGHPTSRTVHQSGAGPSIIHCGESSS